MDDALTLLFEMKLTDTEKEQEIIIRKLIQLVCELNEEDDDSKEKILKAITDHEIMTVLLAHLKNKSVCENESLLTNVAQLLAELAKSENLREPLVNIGIVPHLLSLLQSKNIALATQACRALGNICFDNDQGRLAVDKEGGLTVIVNVLSSQIGNTVEGASRLRVILCGFLLNLTNNCGLSHRAVGLLDSKCTYHYQMTENIS
ncbi:Rap1 GTPase-GDP dissociation stimulator 1-A [Bulinus truncatus]|nr:Rap1 GTPase-GDP dissociation stimulator 1-A [Bulinus truncatus]